MPYREQVLLSAFLVSTKFNVDELLDGYNVERLREAGFPNLTHSHLSQLEAAMLVLLDWRLDVRRCSYALYVYDLRALVASVSVVPRFSESPTSTRPPEDKTVQLHGRRSDDVQGSVTSELRAKRRLCLTTSRAKDTGSPNCQRREEGFCHGDRHMPTCRSPDTSVCECVSPWSSVLEDGGGTLQPYGRLDRAWCMDSRCAWRRVDV